MSDATTTGIDDEAPQTAGVMYLRMLHDALGLQLPGASARHLAADATAGGIVELCEAAGRAGLATRLVPFDLGRSDRIDGPMIIDLDPIGLCLLITADGASLVIRHRPDAPPIVVERRPGPRPSGLALALDLEGGGAHAPAAGFSRFISMLARHSPLLIEICAARIVMNLCVMATPIAFGLVLDKVLAHRSESALTTICAGLALVSLLEFGLSYHKNIVFHLLRNHLRAAACRRFFSAAIALPINAIRSYGAAALKLGYEREGLAAHFAIDAAQILLSSPPLILFLFGVLFAYSKILSSTILVIYLAYGAILLAIAPIIKQRSRKYHKSEASEARRTGEYFSGLEVILLTGAERWFMSRVTEAQAKTAALKQRMDAVRTAGEYAGVLCRRLVFVAVLWFGMVEVQLGLLSIGALVTFVTLQRQLCTLIEQLVPYWHRWSDVHAMIEQSDKGRKEFAAAEPGPVTTAAAGELQIELSHVSFAHAGGAGRTFSDLSLRINRGEVVGIVGPSGSGKTTLLNLIQGLLRARDGTVRISGVDQGGPQNHVVRDMIATVPQDPTLFSLTIRQNIALRFPAAPLEAVIAASRLAGAHEFVEALPRGYETLLPEGGKSLSLGQRQRIAVARALLHAPDILLLDEATSALDFEAEAGIVRALQGLTKGRITLIVTHRAPLLQLCSRILVFDQASVVFDGLPARAREQSPYYRGLVGSGRAAASSTGSLEVVRGTVS